jgi:hypothetical protein
MVLHGGHDMKLKEWMDREEVSNQEFGKRIERSSEAVRRYAEGLRIPDRETMPLIVRETNGEVQPNDFFDLPEQASSAQSEDVSAAANAQAAA